MSAEATRARSFDRVVLVAILGVMATIVVAWTILLVWVASRMWLAAVR